MQKKIYYGLLIILLSIKTTYSSLESNHKKEMLATHIDHRKIALLLTLSHLFLRSAQAFIDETSATHMPRMEALD